jgi:magnesium-transporting ATPase (P-type)
MAAQPNVSEAPEDRLPPYRDAAAEVVSALGGDTRRGLRAVEVQERLRRHGRNELPSLPAVPAWLMSTAHSDAADGARVPVFAKGAPDVLLARCTEERVGGGTRALTRSRREEISRAVDGLGSAALRTIGVAYRTLGRDALGGELSDSGSMIARFEDRSAFHELIANRWLWLAVLGSAALQVAVVHAPFLQRAFRTVTLAPRDWLICVTVASSVLWAMELKKRVVRARE